MPKRVTPSERARGWSEDHTTAVVDPALIPASEPLAGRFLVVRDGERVTFLDLPAQGEWSIGRDRAGTICLDDVGVSRRHARLRISSAVVVEDLGSRNGTQVNGRVLNREASPIETGDVIQIGGCQLFFAFRTDPNAPALSAARSQPDGAILADPEMARVYGNVKKVAPMPTTVLVLGETGAGKDVLARQLHAWSPRAAKPFVRVNCAGIPETLLVSELFGHERGAFTGADRRRAGYFEAAQGGTLFLDEIGELSPGAQVKLLHVLENHALVRLGGTEELAVDVRVVCATHRDLKALVEADQFRADLYFRISAFVVRIPPLRERGLEIKLLALDFARRLAEQLSRPAPQIAADAIELLTAYRWPGNVRELRNAIEHAFTMAEGGTLRAEHFATELKGGAQTRPAEAPSSRSRLNDEERRAILSALAAEGGNQTRAASRLGMPRRTLVYKLARWRSVRDPAGDDEG